MSQQLQDLQAAITSLQAEDAATTAAIGNAVTELQSLEAQVATLIAANAGGDPTDTAALEALAASVSVVTGHLSSAVTSLAAAAPAPSTPAPAPATSAPSAS